MIHPSKAGEFKSEVYIKIVPKGTLLSTYFHSFDYFPIALIVFLFGIHSQEIRSVAPDFGIKYGSYS